MHKNLFLEIISLENLFLSWKEFKKEKRGKIDVQIFERNLEDNLFELHNELKNKTYRHSNYTSFYITDPKRRHIHKACVRDRIVHHAIHRVLYSIFNPIFIDDSYSCRKKKGTHRAVKRLENFTRIVSRNYTRPCFILKCDVKKFFDSVDHRVLFELLKRKISDADTLCLLKEIIGSFGKTDVINMKRGIPIGNLTSQLFANVYMNEFDRFIKHDLKIKYYLRYCDDFVILANDPKYLEELIVKIESFLHDRLKLKLHDNKVSVRKLNQGIDFLGYVVRPHCIVLRTRTKKRMFRRVNKNNLASYSGLLEHCNGYKLRQSITRLIKAER